MEFDLFIFIEIAAQQDRDGATVDVIREGVDYRQKMALTWTEINAALNRLAVSKLIQANDERYCIVESIVPSLPKTASGKLSFRRQEWDKLWQRLYAK